MRLKHFGDTPFICNGFDESVKFIISFDQIKRKIKSIMSFSTSLEKENLFLPMIFFQQLLAWQYLIT